MAFVTDPQWKEGIGEVAPMSAGLAVQATRDLESLPIGPWTGLAVMAAYAGVAMSVGAALFQTRDV